MTTDTQSVDVAQNLAKPVSRRTALGTGGTFALAAGAFVASGGLLIPGKALALPSMEEMTAERVLGDPNAPVTVTEFASLACPHCARFHNTIFPEIKKKYVDTGKAKFIYIDFPTSPPQVSIGGAMIARCAPAERYFGMLEIFYQDQASWFQSNNLLTALTESARKGGLSSETVQECLRQEDLLNHITKAAEVASQKHGIRGTPSFLINGELLNEDATVESLSKAIDAKLK